MYVVLFGFPHFSVIYILFDNSLTYKNNIFTNLTFPLAYILCNERVVERIEDDDVSDDISRRLLVSMRSNLARHGVY